MSGNVALVPPDGSIKVFILFGFRIGVQSDLFLSIYIVTTRGHLALLDSRLNTLDGWHTSRSHSTTVDSGANWPRPALLSSQQYNKIIKINPRPSGH